MKQKLKFIVLFGFIFSSSFAQQLNTAKLDSLFQILEAKNKYMGSIGIAENGKLLYTKSIGSADIAANVKASALTKYRIGSISKMFTACLVFKAIEEGKLNLNQTIDSYFPSIEKANKITIGQLLNHRSGIHNFTNDDNYLTYNTEPKTEAQMVDIIAKGKSDFEPNSKADYSNSNYVLLSYILEKTYKKAYKDILTKKIIKPLGLTNTYFGGKTSIQDNECFSYSFAETWQKEAETDMSIPMGAGALVSNPTDLVIFIDQLFAHKIISASSLEQMKTMTDHYGMGIFQMPFYDKTGYGHTGGIDGFGSVLSYFPENKLAVALTSNGMVYENSNVMIAALSAYFNKSFTIPTFKIMELTSADLDQYLGEYANPTFPLKIKVTKKEAQLYAQATGQSAFPLDATEQDTFEFTAANIKMEFKPKENQMSITQGGRKTVMTRKP
jgi:CubicO group peptidase (beta-lactamase class C family)